MGLIKVIIYIGIFVLGFLGGFVVHGWYVDAGVKLSEMGITGNVVELENFSNGNYSWTTAVCNYREF
ncbi:MAG: hypothetical protein AABX11_02205 [Nanoarchaeota archaeon]